MLGYSLLKERQGRGVGEEGTVVGKGVGAKEGSNEEGGIEQNNKKYIEPQQYNFFLPQVVSRIGLSIIHEP